MPDTLYKIKSVIFGHAVADALGVPVEFASRAELKDMLLWAVEKQKGPVAIRYPRGGDRDYAGSAWQSALDTAVIEKQGGNTVLLTYGVLLKNAMDAAGLLADHGIDASVVRLLTISPLPVKALADMLPKNSKIFVPEEVGGRCGICQELAYALKDLRPDCCVYGIDLGCRYVQHGAVDTLYSHYGLSAEAITKFVLEEHRVEN